MTKKTLPLVRAVGCQYAYPGLTAAGTGPPAWVPAPTAAFFCGATVRGVACVAACRSGWRSAVDFASATVFSYFLTAVRYAAESSTLRAERIRSGVQKLSTACAALTDRPNWARPAAQASAVTVGVPKALSDAAGTASGLAAAGVPATASAVADERTASSTAPPRHRHRFADCMSRSPLDEPGVRPPVQADGDAATGAKP
jgi:hypothetical protein